MKFLDFVNENFRRTREVTNFITYPVASVRRWGENRVSTFFKDLSFAKKEENSTNNNTNNNGANNTYTIPSENNNHFVTQSNQLETPVLSYAFQIGDKVGEELDLIRLDTYTIIEAKQIDDNESLYIAQNNQDKVFIKQYNLINSNPEEIKQIQKNFQDIIDLNIKIGREYDFRILNLIDRFTEDKSCFLITKYITGAVPLKDYLQENREIKHKQIKAIIQQVLESLLFLHSTYRAKFKTDKQELKQGMSHGNINLNSLLIKDIKETGVEDERRFFIYLTDLALWKNLVHPNLTYSSKNITKNIIQNDEYIGDKSKDFFDLGKLALALISRRYDEYSWQIIDSQAEDILRSIQNTRFANFIRRLLNKNKPFKAEEALEEIIRINLNQNNIYRPTQLPNNISTFIEIENQSNPNFVLKVFTYSSLSLLALGLAIWGILNSQPSKPQTRSIPTNNYNDSDCCLAKQELENIKGKYLLESTWENATKRPFFDKQGTKSNFMGFLKQKGLAITPIVAKNPTYQDIYNKLLKGDIKFALTRLSENTNNELVGGLTQSQPVAYDALVVFVAFKYSLLPNDAPAKLLDGKITKEEISELYTQNNLQRLPRDKYKTILYLPDDKETQVIFRQQLLKIIAEVKSKNPTSSIKLDDLDKTIINSKKLPSTSLFQAVRDKTVMTENAQSTIIIGVDRLSRLFGQCSVYPLAIVNDSNQPIQLLKQSNGEDIQANDKNLDLCNDKGTYFKNAEALKSGEYPLTYKLGVVYKQENRQEGKQLEQALQKDEAQYILNQVGLVPVKPISGIYK